MQSPMLERLVTGLLFRLVPQQFAPLTDRAVHIQDCVDDLPTEGIAGTPTRLAGGNKKSPHGSFASA